MLQPATEMKQGFEFKQRLYHRRWREALGETLLALTVFSAKSTKARVITTLMSWKTHLHNVAKVRFISHLWRSQIGTGKKI